MTITINNNLSRLTENILEDINRKKRNIILIGGLSRSGKSFVANEVSNLLNEKGYKSIIVKLDWWLIGVDKRETDSTVLSRYDIGEIENSIIQLMQGKPIYHPLYDPIKRKRIKDQCDESVQIENGIIIIDGVVALAIPNLLKMAYLKIYVDISNELRMKRLSEFYLEYKNITKNEFEELLNRREKEEVPYIKKTKKNADIIFLNN